MSDMVERREAAPLRQAYPAAGREHVLKAWPTYFAAVVDGRKRFELRRNDRDFAVGDVLRLVEWIPGTSYGNATGRVFRVRVTYLAQGIFCLPPDLCVMSVEAIDIAPAMLGNPFCDPITAAWPDKPTGAVSDDGAVPDNTHVVRAPEQETRNQ